MKKAILVVLLLALLTLPLSGCASPEERAYNSGQKALAKEKYGDAVTAFEKAGSFEDSELLLQYATAFRNLENGVYADAAAGFQALGDFKDSQLMNIYCLAREQESLAQAAIAEGDADKAAGAMQEALAGYSRLSQFRDSDTRATECRELLYNKSNEWLTIERYDAAAAGFTALDGWQDSAQRQKYCEAAMLEEQSSFVEAAAIYDEIPGVLDASARAEEARSQAYQMASDLRENGDYIAAANAFAALGSYRDAEEQRVSTCVSQVRNLLHSGSYTQALKELSRLDAPSLFPAVDSSETRSAELFLDSFLNTWLTAHSGIMNGFFSCNALQPYLEPGGELDTQIHAELTDEGMPVNFGYVYRGMEMSELLQLDDHFISARVHGTASHGSSEGTVEMDENLLVLIDTSGNVPLAAAVIPV